MYVRLLGPNGHRLLTEEVKWLAVTHKSFDHGRRGFNDRLATLGHRILNLQASLVIIDADSMNIHNSPREEVNEIHPALKGIERLDVNSTEQMLTKRRLSALASKVGLDEVIRWKPRQPTDLHGSGIDAVLVESLFAIVGAVALQKGGEAAANVARERILPVTTSGGSR
ncbi:MAG: hypothetical protein M1825_005936 [Sarcosagium campestre]|nr:MAG: hypothetical protein M1825_005936 [Sarcosagium campestre]